MRLHGAQADLRVTVQSSALRELQYGPSTKIGVKFKSAWWEDPDRMGRTETMSGGQSFTDRMLRTVVYPSYGLDGGRRSTVLIASYCWTDDAERLAALITNEEQKPVLVQLVLRELARIHDFDIEFLRGQLIDTHAWSWSHDPCTMGTSWLILHLSLPYVSFPSMSTHGARRCLRILRARQVQQRVPVAHASRWRQAAPLRG